MELRACVTESESHMPYMAMCLSRDPVMCVPGCIYGGVHAMVVVQIAPITWSRDSLSRDREIVHPMIAHSLIP